MKQVGRYQILDELGRGAMGVVYKAQDPAIGRTVAIKTIRLGELPDPEERVRVRERLLREAQSAGILSHPNIVTIYDVLQETDFAYVVMEYVTGMSLEAMLRGQALPERTALLHFLRQVSDALDYAHHKGIVHRDIKPANIILAEPAPGFEPRAKVTDFGVAKFVSHEITHSGTMIGTPYYLSPEQIQGLTVDGRSDQFSLAVMVYELLSGEKPFEAENLPGLFYKICRQEPRPIEEVNSTLSESPGKVLSRALAKEPGERFASCGDFMGALAVALGDSPDWAAAPAALAKA
ncbi:MAG: serine/threonine-protein kinase, partial [Bryobacteraceae bacterium]